jgi:signal transduction histidine kinase
VGYSEMLEEDALAAGQTGCASDLAKVLSAARQLLGLISDVLDLSKIEAGKMKVVLEPVDIGALADEVAATIEPLTKKNGNVFEFRREDFQGVMYTDGGKLRQVLLNLLSNACKFTSNGNIALRITRRELDGREWTDWHVSDSGIGIAPEDLQKLFHAFTQVDASATRRHGGTGLGLAISQRFCQMLGGRISVESSPGKGSTFTIQLPVDSGTQPDPQEESQPEALTQLHCALAAGGRPDDNRNAGLLNKGEKVPRDA